MGLLRRAQGRLSIVACNRNAVRRQLDLNRHTARPGVRAVRVDPLLLNQQLGQLGIGDLFLIERVVLAIRVSRLVVLDRALDDLIGVELARLGRRRVAVLIELGELVSVAGPRRGDASDLFPIGRFGDLRVSGAVQLQGDLVRVGMLFLVHPNLGAGDFRLFLGIGVGHGHGADAGFSVDGDVRRGRFPCSALIVHLDCGDAGVAGDVSIGFFYGVGLAGLNAVRLGQRQHAILVEVGIGLGDRSEALAGYSEGNIFLLLVRQCRAGEALGDGQAGGLFRVGDDVAFCGVAADRGGELAAVHAGHARFDHTVGDRGRGHGAVCINGNCVLGQVFKGIARILRGQLCGLSCHSLGGIAAVQLHSNGDALRPILALHLRHGRRIRKRPSLVHRDLGRFFLVGDGDGGLVGALHRITNFSSVTGNLDFLHAVGDVGPLSFSVLFLRGQVLKGVSGMRRRQLSLDRRLRFAFALHDGLAIGSQLHGDLYTSRPGIRAVSVDPLLVDFDIGYFNSIREGSGSGIRQRIIDARNNRYRLGILAFHPGTVFGGGFGNAVRAFRQARDDEPAILRRQVLLIGCRIQDRRDRNAIADSDHHNSGVIIRSRNREGVFAVRHLQLIVGRLIVIDPHQLGQLQGAVGLILVGKDRFGHNLLFNCAGFAGLVQEGISLNGFFHHGIAYAKRKPLDGRLLAGQQGDRGRVIRNSDGRGIALASRVDDEGILAVHFASGEGNGEGEGLRLHALGQVFRQHLLELHVAAGDLAVGDGQRTVVRVHNAFAVVGIDDFVVLGGDGRLLLNRVGQGVGDTVLNESSIQFFKCIGPAVFFIQGAFEAGAFFHGFALLVGLDHKQLDQDLVRLFVAVRIEHLMNLNAGGLGDHLVGHGDRAGRDASAVIGIGRGIVVDPLFNDGVLDGLGVLHRGQLGPDVIRPLAVRTSVDGNRVTNRFLRAVCLDLVQLQLDTVRRAGLEQVVTVVHPALGGRNGGIFLLDIGRGPGSQVRHRRDTNIVRRLARVVQGPGNLFMLQLLGIRHQRLRVLVAVDIDMLIHHEVVVFITGGVACRRLCFLPGVQLAFAKPIPLRSALAGGHHRSADRPVFRDFELRQLRIGQLFVQQAEQPLMMRLIGHFALGQHTLIELEFRTAQLGGEVVFINLMQEELLAVNLNAGVVGLDIMLFRHSGTVAAAANQGRGILECILALRTRETGIGQQNSRLIRDTANGQQTRIVIIRNLKTSRHGAAMHQLAIRAHSGDGHLDRRRIQVHIGINTIRQRQGFAVIHIVRMRVDFYAIGYILAGDDVAHSIIRDNNPALFPGGVFFVDVAVRGDGDCVGRVKWLAVTVGDCYGIGETLTAAGGTGNAIPFLIGELSIIGNNDFIAIQTKVLIAIRIIRIMCGNIQFFDCGVTDCYRFDSNPVQRITLKTDTNRWIIRQLRIIIQQRHATGYMIRKPYINRIRISILLLGRIDQNLPLDDSVVFRIRSILDQVDIRCIIRSVGFSSFVVVQPDFVMHDCSIYDFHRGFERQFDNHSLVKLRETEHGIVAVYRIINARCQHSTIFQ